MRETPAHGSFRAVAHGAGWLLPDWMAPADVHAVVTTRRGGVSAGPWGDAAGAPCGMNLGFGSGDDRAAVEANRARLAALLPSSPVWLRQVHGADVIDADGLVAQASAADSAHGTDATGTEPPTADAAVALAPGVVCVVMVADCLPVFFTDRAGRAVGVAHAGWRGLAAGILEATVARLRERLGEPAAPMLAWLGPAIGPEHFEVGADVLDAMLARWPDAGRAFSASPLGRAGKWHADLFALARRALADCGAIEVTGGGYGTAGDAQRFYSHRRDAGRTGRHAALIWREPASA